MFDLVVTRHPGALAWLANHLSSEHMAYHVTTDGLMLVARDLEFGCGEVCRIPIVSQVGPDDIRGKHVVGNLPLHLACLAASVTAIEFDGPPPRGAEYTADDMERAGARLCKYRVVQE